MKFSLKTLLVLVTACAVIVGVGSFIHQRNQQINAEMDRAMAELMGEMLFDPAPEEVTTGDNDQSPTESQHSARLEMTATVVSYEHNVQWSHFEDGSFAAYDRLKLQLESNDSLSVSVTTTELPDDSPFRRAGTRFTFTLTDPIRPDVHLAWGAINNPTVIE